MAYFAEASTMECGGERQAHIAHSNDSGHVRLSFNALQQRRKVSGAFIRLLLTGWVEHEPSQFSLV